MENEHEILTVDNVYICTCNRVMRDSMDFPDDYDTLGADKCVCCPDCGNEDFLTIAQLLKQKRGN